MIKIIAEVHNKIKIHKIILKQSYRHVASINRNKKFRIDKNISLGYKDFNKDFRAMNGRNKLMKNNKINK
jgi:hypothetical protein